MVGLTNHVNFFADFGLGGFGRKVALAGNKGFAIVGRNCKIQRYFFD
jgi:hypothetical protein